ncbi:AbiH family protein [Companilactobacillus nantensis]|uniref:Phage abortive infection protein n=1 Tax=Companilactobacillus nantensis DSM 16982 TaxID=1423774 RepID=A0A0R1WBY7_9LACO|nr:AbiH family protein [Companilactobacillus nantensis]KRM15470.1 hypothetical protein FD31_GL001185 [Companilactobacillus nantensis DSM 16982]GEO64362.1 hypothetical protein LNA01_15450 [Companilactobacillus nantensis]
MEQANEVKSLIILGNGFDLKCGLSSSFQQFFENLKRNFPSNDLKVLKELFKEEFIDFPIESKDSPRGYEEAGFDEYIEVKLNKNDFRNTQWLELLQKFSNLISPELKKMGFWTSCFIIFCTDSKYWYNIEGFISDFFTEESYEIGKKSPLTRINTIAETRFSAVGEYIKDLSREDESSIADARRFDLITKKIAFLLVNIFEYNINIDLSEFLLNQLKIFENLLDNYLIGQSESDSYYKSETKNILEKLSERESYNQLNFNYTIAESKSINIRRNIHSTLRHKPIIGIDADKVFADNRIYKFTKTYRIMRLAMNSDDSELVPKSIAKIIFYGHSLAQADYSYFQSIFDKCDIYHNSVILEFYYSTYEGCNEEQATRTMFDRVSQLLDNYGKTIPNHGKNFMVKIYYQKCYWKIELELKNYSI